MNRTVKILTFLLFCLTIFGLGLSVKAAPLVFDWAKEIDQSDKYIDRVVTDNNSNIYLVGDFYENTFFDPNNNTNPDSFLEYQDGYSNSFILKLNSAGEFQWVKALQYNGSGSVEHLSITIDGEGNIIIGSSLYKNGGDLILLANSSSTTIIENNDNTNNSNFFVAKLNSNGELLWSKKITNDNYVKLQNLKSDNSGNIILAGNFQNNLTVDGITLQNDSIDDDKFFIKLNSEGNLLWLRGLEANSWLEIFFDLDSNDNIFFSFSFSDSSGFVFYSDSFTSTSSHPQINRSAYLAKILADGSLGWVKTFGNSTENPMVKVDPLDNVYFSFYNGWNNSLGLLNITNNTFEAVADSFIELSGGNSNNYLKLTNNGDFQWIRAFDYGYGYGFVFLGTDLIVNIENINNQPSFYTTTSSLPLNIYLGNTNSFIFQLSATGDYLGVNGHVSSDGSFSVENNDLISINNNLYLSSYLYSESEEPITANINPILTDTPENITLEAGGERYFLIKLINAEYDPVSSAPTNFTATPNNSHEINLTWNDPEDNTSNYVIKYSENIINESNFSSAETITGSLTASTSVSFLVTDLSAATNYYFAIKTINTSGISSEIVYAQASTPTDTTSLAPLNFTTSLLSANTINLSWNDNEYNTASYSLKISTSSINASNFNSAPDFPTTPEPETNPSVSLGNLNYDTTYYFALRTIDEFSNLSTIVYSQIKTRPGIVLPGNGEWINTNETNINSQEISDNGQNVTFLLKDSSNNIYSVANSDLDYGLLSINKLTGVTWETVTGATSVNCDLMTAVISSEDEVYTVCKNTGVININKFNLNTKEWENLAPITSSWNKIAFELDNNNIPYIYINDSIYKYVNSSWQIIYNYVSNDGIDPGAGGGVLILAVGDYVGDLEMTFDRNNNLYFVYPLNNTLKVKKYDGTNFSLVGSFNFSESIENNYIDITTDYFNNPIVLYQAIDYGTRVRKYTNNSWDLLANSYGGFVGSKLFINEDTLFISGRKFGLEQTTAVILFNGSNWTSLGDNIFQKETLSDSNLLVVDNKIYLASWEKTEGQELLVAKFTTNKEIYYSGSFVEDYRNNGTIEGSLTAVIANANFSNAGGTLTEGVHYTLSNKPRRFTSSITVSADGKKATLTLNGRTNQHKVENSIFNLGLNFNNSAFNGSLSSQITDSSYGSGVIKFVSAPYSMSIDLNFNDYFNGPYNEKNIKPLAVKKNNGDIFIAYQEADTGDFVIRKYNHQTSVWTNINKTDYAAFIPLFEIKEFSVAKDVNENLYFFFSYTNDTYQLLRLNTNNTWENIYLSSDYRDLNLSSDLAGNIYLFHGSDLGSFVSILDLEDDSWDMIGNEFSLTENYQNIFLSANENSYLVSQNNSNYPYYLKKLINNSWQNLSLPLNNNDGQRDYLLDVVISSNGSLYLAYLENSTGYTVIKSFNGYNWSLISRTYRGNFNNLDLELINDKLFLAYSDSDKGYEAKVVKIVNGADSDVSRPGSLGRHSYLPSIITGADDNLVLIYNDLLKEVFVRQFYLAPAIDNINTAITENDASLSWEVSDGIENVNNYSVQYTQINTLDEYGDNDWLEINNLTETEVTLENLNDGFYRTEVVALDSFGINSETVEAIITINSPVLAEDFLDLISTKIIIPGSGDINNTESFSFNQRILISYPNGTIAEIPNNTIMTASSSFSLYDLNAGSANISDLTINNHLHSIQLGLSSLGLSLNQSITITIPAPGINNGQSLDVYAKNPGGVWNKLTSCSVIAGACSFQTNHLSEFALIGLPATTSSNSAPIAPVCSEVIFTDFSTNCSNGYHYRGIKMKSPANCSLSAEQLAAAQKICNNPLPQENQDEEIINEKENSNLNSLGRALFLNKERQLVKKINPSLTKKLLGRILLQVQEKGEAWYLNPLDSKKYFLGRPSDAFNLMRQLGLGISNKDFDSFKGAAPKRLAGRILIKVEDLGKAYYVNPLNLKMSFLGRPGDAFNLMRQLGLGISNYDLRQIAVE